MSDQVVLDANVLVPIALCDLLLRSAEAELFRPQWTEMILAETRRGVVRTLLRHGLESSEAMTSVDRRIAQMKESFPTATVTGWEPHVSGVALPDPDDRHVVAAAIRCGASTIVTQNLGDFPADRLPDGIGAVNADDFLLRMLDRSTAEIAMCVRAQSEQSGRHGHPLLTMDLVLARLRPSAPRFVAAISEAMERG